MGMTLTSINFNGRTSYGLAATVPTSPTGATATGGDAQATVTFTAPISNGGSPITGYTVVSSPAGGTDTNAGTTGLSHVVTGLTNGVAYTFQVYATNALGNSANSASSNAVTPAAASSFTFSTSAMPINTGSIQAVSYVNSTFVGLTKAAGSIGYRKTVRSTDNGATWTAGTASAFNINEPVSNGSIVVTSGTSSTSSYLTTDGSGTWTSRTYPVSGNWVTPTFANGEFFVAKWDGTKVLYKSSNGINWSAVSIPAAALNTQSQVGYINGLYVVVGATGSFYTSPNLTEWTARSWAPFTAETNFGLNGIHIQNNKLLTQSSTGTVAVTSDGINWSVNSAPWGSSTLVWIVPGNNLFVATRSGAAWYTSPDGITWTTRTGPVGQLSSAPAYGGGSLFVAVVPNTTSAASASSARIMNIT